MDESTWPTVYERSFVPIVHDMRLTYDMRFEEAVDSAVRQAVRWNDTRDLDTITTPIPGVHVCPKAVEPHQDLNGAKPGMLVRGLVLRNDGHRLHSQRLNQSGMREGLPLKAGDVYEIDPYDEHWTTTPDDVEYPILVILVEGHMPKEAPLREAAERMLVELDQDLDGWWNDDRGGWRR